MPAASNEPSIACFGAAQRRAVRRSKTAVGAGLVKCWGLCMRWRRTADDWQMCGSALRWTSTAPVTQANGEHAARRVQTASETGAGVPPASLLMGGACRACVDGELWAGSASSASCSPIQTPAPISCPAPSKESQLRGRHTRASAPRSAIAPTRSSLASSARRMRRARFLGAFRTCV